MTTQEKKAAQNKRKRASRARLKAQGMKKTEVTLSATDREKLQRLCEVRGGVRGPYEVDEFIATLIRRDHEILLKQLEALGQCQACKQALPAGCNGAFQGQSDCYHTLDYRQLYL